MTWKSYALMSGATLMAGWLASSPPAGPAANVASPSAQPGAVPTSGPSEIEVEAARLQTRVREAVEFQEPSRNPFRFAPPVRRSQPPADMLPPALLPAELPLPPPLVVLTGIAADRDGDQMTRTAILSGPSGILLVREGDDVLGQFRVARIEAEAVELVRPDGTTLTLTFRP